MQKILLGVCLLCVSFHTLADTKPNQSTLNQLNNQISELTTDLQQQQTSRDALQNHLQQLELNLATLSETRQQSQNQIQTKKKSLKTLHQLQDEYSANLAAQQQQLLQEIRAAYMQERPNFVKFILTQNTIHEAERNLIYYQYVLENQKLLINKIQKSLQLLAENKNLMEQQTQELEALNHQQTLAVTEIKNTQVQRKQLLNELNNTIQDKNSHLQLLIANKKQLETVLSQIKKNQAKPNTAAITVTPQHHGKLPWPARGKVVADFNSPIEATEIKLNGVLISAAEGEKVHAIAAGRVEFSQWLSGYGMLMIIDHGNGLMSLYGRNQNLYKKTGDMVKAGDLIATVGKTGGYPISSLYFAIRKQGEPVNPADMCI
jgi:septal ring factor EnvC (AmiA/AmiB activator)